MTSVKPFGDTFVCMTDKKSPVEMLFEMQRETIKGTEAVIENAFDITATLGENVTAGVDTQRELQAHTLELTRDSIHRSIDAAEAVTETTAAAGTVPAPTGNLDELRESVDTTFDSLIEQQEEAFEVLDEQYDEFNEDTLDNVETQVDLLIEMSERLETQLVESVERFVEQAEDAEVLPGGLEEQLERLAEQMEEQADRFNALEDQFATIEIESHSND